MHEICTIIVGHVNDIVDIVALLTSIIIFKKTVKISDKDRKNNLKSEMFKSFLENLDSFFEIINSENFYDNFAYIYSGESFDYNKKYASLQRSISEIQYVHKKVILYLPQDGDIAEIIERLTERLTNMAMDIISNLCKDIISLNNDCRIPSSNVSQLLKDYDEFYLKTVNFIYKGIHITRNFITEDKKALKEYFDEYKENFDEI